jgi:hypothetical protein
MKPLTVGQVVEHLSGCEGSSLVPLVFCVGSVTVSAGSTTGAELPLQVSELNLQASFLLGRGLDWVIKKTESINC